MHLIDDQVVNTGRFEGDAGVAGCRELTLDPLFVTRERLLHRLERPAGSIAAFVGGFELASKLCDLTVDVSGLMVGAEVQGLKRGTGEDDRIPVVGGCAGDELAPLVTGEVVAGRGEDACLRVQLKPLSGDLFEHVVGHDHGWFGDHAEPSELGGADDHLGGFSCTDLVEQPN